MMCCLWRNKDNHAYARQCNTLCQKPFAQYMENGIFDPSVNRKRLKILRCRLGYIITLRSRVVMQNLTKNRLTHFGQANGGNFSFFLTSTQSDRQSINQSINQSNYFFRLVYRSQIQKYVKQLEFKTRGLTHRCAFQGLQHLNVIFSRIFFQKIRENQGKIGNFKLKW